MKAQIKRKSRAALRKAGPKHRGAWPGLEAECIGLLDGVSLNGDSVELAERVQLRYISDAIPGIRRRRAGKGFGYCGPDGERVRDRAVRQRIEALVIPAAWRDVWISPIPDGHLQATGRDARGRKQYIYHPMWRCLREQTKYNRMIAFGEALPLIRERTECDLALRGLPMEKVLAAVVELLQITLIRVGNREYVKDNLSYGLTTMRDRHLDVSGAVIRFEFRGKSGKEHSVEVYDRRLARIVRRCRDIPGHELFQYMDGDGRRQPIDSSDVNRYLQEITGERFTAKDFRTWGGTVKAALALAELGPAETESDARKNIVQAVKQVAEHLGNKPSICRKYYVHPAVIDAYLQGGLMPVLEASRQRLEGGAEGGSPADGGGGNGASALGLRPEESAVLDIIRSYEEQER